MGMKLLQQKCQRQDFPLLRQKNPLIYFDNACQTLRPQCVIDAVNEYLTDYPACAGRSMHALANRVQTEVGLARVKLQKFLGAKHSSEIIFTRNTTEGINLLSACLDWREGDWVLIGDKEHNSNLVPWQRLKKTKGINLQILQSNDDGTFDLPTLKVLCAKKRRWRLFSFGLTANLDGVSIPATEIVKHAHRAGALIHFDGAQAVPHQTVKVNKLDCDFLSFSGHKMFGPSGTGVFYGKKALLEKLQPFMVGGDTVARTTYEDAEFLPIPEKFEAGLQDYAGIIGLGVAADYLQKIGFANIAKTELAINEYLTKELSKIPDLKLIGPGDPKLRSGIISFYLPDIDHHQIALLLDKTFQVAVRSGQHCVHSWFTSRQIAGSVRASFYAYNTLAEAEILVNSLRQVIKVLR